MSGGDGGEDAPYDPADHPSPIDGHVDPDVPWAMQIALRYDKSALPTHEAACAATARAVVTLLADERSRGEGPWAPAVHRWRDGRIRKLVRRARGVRWDRVQDLPGVTVSERGAQVRAFVPAPARPLPPALDELQVTGTNYPSAGSRTDGDEGHAPRAPAAVLLALRPGLDLSTGKAAAQCGHAAQLAWEELVRRGDAVTLRRWYDDDWRVDVLVVGEDDWVALSGAPVRVVDAGFTELDGPTETTRAWW